MKIEGLLQILGDSIKAPDEETYDLFSQDLPSQNLGFIDPKAQILELNIAGRDLTVRQSPGALTSNRPGGTTGAVVWKVTPLFAEWISSPDHNPLFAHGLLGPSSLVIELGCGISALVGLLLAPRISRMILTDQDYVAKLVEQNIAENEVNHDATHNPNKSPPPPLAKAARSSAAPSKGKARPPHPVPAPARHHRQGSQAPIHFSTLDWETDVPTSALTLSSPGESKSFDVVVACDCIYNEALIDPFVSTCADVCRLRSAEVEDDPGSSLEPCVCIVAQQLRDPDVFEAWLTRFAEPFDTYRVPDELLIEGLQSENSGFVVHLGVLKGAVPPRIQ